MCQAKFSRGGGSWKHHELWSEKKAAASEAASRKKVAKVLEKKQWSRSF